MEANQATAVNSDQGTSFSEEQGPSQARSYECNFCKRGFSNAQALGGHMNIHRKDKTKLKQASKEANPFLEIPKSNASPFFPSGADQPSVFKSSFERSSTNWPRPWIFSSENEASSRLETYVRDPQQLPLFVERTSRDEDQNPSNHDAAMIHQEPFGYEPFGYEPFGMELDLELRLGHEPPDSSSATIGTRKFF